MRRFTLFNKLHDVNNCVGCSFAASCVFEWVAIPHRISRALERCAQKILYYVDQCHAPAKRVHNRARLRSGMTMSDLDIYLILTVDSALL